ncbi:MAG: 50S ribosomal protein L25 [Deltaproteobacteria bacterium]|nr:50S ribosomal protein L25 [Deltaproteobacteria bacterium]
MNTIAIDVRPRALTGTGVAKKIRRAGLVPGVVYGHGVEGNVNVAFDPRSVVKGLSGAYGRNQLFTFEIDGKQHLAICRQVEVHPVSRKLSHVDFFAVQPDTRIKVTLPIRLTGRSAGQKAGGRLDVTARFVNVHTTPAHLPTSIDVRLEPYKNGQLLGVEALPFPEGVTPVFRQAFKVFELVAPKVVKVEEVDPKAKKKK